MAAAVVAAAAVAAAGGGGGRRWRCSSRRQADPRWVRASARVVAAPLPRRDRVLDPAPAAKVGGGGANGAGRRQGGGAAKTGGAGPGAGNPSQPRPTPELSQCRRTRGGAVPKVDGGAGRRPAPGWCRWREPGRAVNDFFNGPGPGGPAGPGRPRHARRVRHRQRERERWVTANWAAARSATANWAAVSETANWPAKRASRPATGPSPTTGLSASKTGQQLAQNPGPSPGNPQRIPRQPSAL